MTIIQRRLKFVQRDDVAPTLRLRCINVVCPLGCYIAGIYQRNWFNSDITSTINWVKFFFFFLLICPKMSKGGDVPVVKI